jgi:undecaprenyl diphosphate synthase
MHVAIIMDGNGRWAERRGLPRQAGHRAGARSVRRVVEAAAKSGVDCLTLYAFSSDNWSRPREEVSHLMQLFKRYLQSEITRCAENGIRLNVIGRRDRLHPDIVTIIERAEAVTAGGTRMLLRLAVDYSARHVVAQSAHRAGLECGCTAKGNERACFEAALAAQMHAAVPAGDVDLLIRSGGERRLSDFLLWECAYAELVFVDTFWPDFDEHDLESALRDFGRRERRFGGRPEPDRSLPAHAEAPQ